MKVFLAATSLAPSYGGPAFSVSQLAETLADKGVRVGVWSADQSVVSTPLLARDSRVCRLTGAEGDALAAFGTADLIHDNGIWMPHNHRLAVLAAAQRIPRLVSTRGMLEPWALRHKRWKKAVAWRAYQKRNLRRADGLHATAAPEAANLERLKLGVPVITIPNGVQLGAPGPAPEMRRDRELTALFLGRIYPVKGLPMLVEAWGRLRPAGWRLHIAGPDEAGHRREVERAVEVASLRSVVSFSGPLDGPAKAAALHSADLLVLPSHSESFGMAVAEGLAHGLPVLTTTAAPWPELVQRRCGWRVEPTVDGLVDGLQAAVSCSAETLRNMGERGRDMIAAEYTWPGVADRFIAAYQQLRAGVAR